ncbi:hypothetical protein L195_g035328 [Trifolium pratense]|uniref:Uncharacterized protein n=2 Tax=Trifolium pratense TaxID=57577 RepID=A0A2K3KIZ3_TRIPR|nr:hypothetical protein L195_g054992 [Trifolium pratense]PNX79344.1 hypothetical protein L195_g035328 [Trifolium pratense]CAJ2648390.1 unnamed protein product [Trifolium pratense]
MDSSSPPHTPISSSPVATPSPPQAPEMNKEQRQLQFITKVIENSEMILEEHRRYANSPEALEAERKRKLRILMSFR